MDNDQDDDTLDALLLLWRRELSEAEARAVVREWRQNGDRWWEWELGGES